MQRNTNKFSGVIFLFVGVLLLLGCAAIDTLDTNPTVVRIATGQAVLRYVEAGETAADRVKRKRDLQAVFNRTLDYMDSDARASAGDVLRVFVSMVDWDTLSAADRMLAIEGVELIQGALQARIRSGELSSDSVLFIRGIVSAALDYLRYM